MGGIEMISEIFLIAVSVIVVAAVIVWMTFLPSVGLLYLAGLL